MRYNVQHEYAVCDVCEKSGYAARWFRKSAQSNICISCYERSGKYIATWVSEFNDDTGISAVVFKKFPDKFTPEKPEHYLINQYQNTRLELMELARNGIISGQTFHYMIDKLENDYYYKRFRDGE